MIARSTRPASMSNIPKPPVIAAGTTRHLTRLGGSLETSIVQKPRVRDSRFKPASEVEQYSSAHASLRNQLRTIRYEMTAAHEASATCYLEAE
jgi:hypothetical protein